MIKPFFSAFFIYVYLLGVNGTDYEETVFEKCLSSSGMFGALTDPMGFPLDVSTFDALTFGTLQVLADGTICSYKDAYVTCVRNSLDSSVYSADQILRHVINMTLFEGVVNFLCSENVTTVVNQLMSCSSDLSTIHTSCMEVDYTSNISFCSNTMTSMVNCLTTYCGSEFGSFVREAARRVFIADCSDYFIPTTTVPTTVNSDTTPVTPASPGLVTSTTSSVVGSVSTSPTGPASGTTITTQSPTYAINSTYSLTNDSSNGVSTTSLSTNSFAPTRSSTNSFSGIVSTLSNTASLTPPSINSFSATSSNFNGVSTMLNSDTTVMTLSPTTSVGSFSTDISDNLSTGTSMIRGFTTSSLSNHETLSTTGISPTSNHLISSVLSTTDVQSVLSTSTMTLTTIVSTTSTVVYPSAVTSTMLSSTTPTTSFTASNSALQSSANLISSTNSTISATSVQTTDSTTSTTSVQSTDSTTSTTSVQSTDSTTSTTSVQTSTEEPYPNLDSGCNCNLGTNTYVSFAVVMFVYVLF